MVYSKTTRQTGAGGGTPINAARLNKLETQYDEAVSYVGEQLKKYVINVKTDYGAVGDGVANDTTAIQNAINAANGRTVFFPAGTYNITALTVANTMHLMGETPASSVLRSTNTTGDVITVNAHDVKISNLFFNSSAVRTSGAAIKGVNGIQHGTVDNIRMSNHAMGIDLDGTVGWTISNVFALTMSPSTSAPSGALIRLGANNYTGATHIESVYQMYPQAPVPATTFMQSGIQLGYVDGVSIYGVTILQCVRGLRISPNTGQVASLIKVSDSVFDSGQIGLLIEPEGSGSVIRSTFAGSWFGANTLRGVITNGGVSTNTNAVTGISFSECEFLQNASHGVTVTGARANGIYFNNSYFAGNSGNGLHIVTSAKNVIVRSCVMGTYGGANGNTDYAIATDSTITGAARDTILEGNTLGRISNAAGASFTTFGNTPW